MSQQGGLNLEQLEPSAKERIEEMARDGARVTDNMGQYMFDYSRAVSAKRCADALERIALIFERGRP